MVRTTSCWKGSGSRSLASRSNNPRHTVKIGPKGPDGTQCVLAPYHDCTTTEEELTWFLRARGILYPNFTFDFHIVWAWFHLNDNTEGFILPLFLINCWFSFASTCLLLLNAQRVWHCTRATFCLFLVDTSGLLPRLLHAQWVDSRSCWKLKGRAPQFRWPISVLAKALSQSFEIRPLTSIPGRVSLWVSLVDSRSVLASPLYGHFLKRTSTNKAKMLV